MRTLAIDIGGTGLKMLTLDAVGTPVSERSRIPTPRPATPEAILAALVELVRDQAEFDRISCGFPGVVVDGVTLNAPNLDPTWAGVELASQLTTALGKPARVANDADVQGYGAMESIGVELVVTLGTGLGSALFHDGVLVPNLELGHAPFRKSKTFEDLLGKEALEARGRKKWRASVDEAIVCWERLFNYRKLFLGGGNAKKLKDVGERVAIVDNKEGLLGGIALWDTRNA